MANFEALRQVVRVLENVSDRDLPFSLDSWAEPLYEDIVESVPFMLLFHRTITKQKECGTSACAMGYAGNDPWFTARGFWLNKINDSEAEPAFENYRGWNAVMSFLDIDGDTANMLFRDSAYIGNNPSAMEVAVRISAWIKKNEKVSKELTVKID